jgi:hypothetical protein
MVSSEKTLLTSILAETLCVHWIFFRKTNLKSWIKEYKLRKQTATFSFPRVKQYLICVLRFLFQKTSTVLSAGSAIPAA